MELWMEESSSDDDFVDSDTEEERRRADQLVSDTDHWLIQKLIRYIKVGLPRTCLPHHTVLALLRNT